MTEQTNILRIDASARAEGSVSRTLTNKTIAHLSSLAATSITTRDVSTGIHLVDSDWIAANFTRPEDRTEAHRTKLKNSDGLVEELKVADVLVIGTPIYNFGIPASLKAWIDKIARVGLTFRYTENGPVGLLEGKRAIILVASGGTQVGSEIDFATPYLRHVLGFIGIHDVTVIAADALSRDADVKMQAAEADIQALTL